MSNPCPTCTTKSAWACPVHAPKHMEAAKPTGPLYDRILAALQAGPMVDNPEWRARQIAELVEGETAQLHAQTAICINALKALDMLIRGKIDQGTAERIIASAEPELVRAGEWLGERDEGMKQAILAQSQTEAERKARLWDEVRPLLAAYRAKPYGAAEMKLGLWLVHHKSELEAE